MIELTKEQKEIHDYILEALPNSRYLALSGYAGTGKTTLLGKLAQYFNKFNYNVVYLCPTGKASVVLKNKIREFGVDAQCETIHSYIYKYFGMNDLGELVWLFQGKKKDSAEILIIDEASMIQEIVYQDLLSLDVPILFVGDPGQLPPVGDKPFRPLIETDLKLKKIHRQALENPIIKLATMVREGENIPFSIFGDEAAKMKIRNHQAQTILNNFRNNLFKGEDGIILCGLNKTRKLFNRQARQRVGLPSYPVKNERLICLRNNKAMNLMNGEIVTIEELENEGNSMYKFKLLELDSESVLCPVSCLNEGIIPKAKFKDYRINFFDYAYCITVHKSQGSEWSKVVLIDERISHQTDDEYRKWLYTGITRAKNKLLILS